MCKHYVSADVSQYGIGAVLLDFKWQPVEYAYRKLTDTEKRYSIVEKEALTTTWAWIKFDTYIVGQRVQDRDRPQATCGYSW